MRDLRRIALAWLPALAVLGAALPGRTGRDDAAERFERTVRPLLVARCVACHGPKNASGGLRLDRPVAPDAAQKLIAALRHDGPLKMPPSGKLPAAESAALTAWAQAGAPWPALPKDGRRAGGRGFQPVRPVLAPPLDGARTDIDAFLLAALRKKGLAFSPPADRRTLIRRVAFDLTGLPPAPAEVEAFVADRRPDAYERLVDRLLASPRYGERWGRHWLDLVRYADSLDARGLGGEGDISEAWRYRDWVIDAFNADLPYDRFIAQQLAGDLLTGSDGDLSLSGTIATGFLAIGNWGNGDADKDKILTDIVDDQIDTVSKAFLGLTVGCARCHDHKFDPISQRDYYALAGIFFSTHILPKLTPKGAGETPLRIPLETKAQQAARAELAQRETERATYHSAQRAAVAAALLPQTGRYLAAVKTGAMATTLEPWALRRWKEALGLVGYPLMTTPIRSLLGHAGIEGVRGPNETPSQLVNTTDQAQPILTFTLPPKSVAVHPGPMNGVAVGWVSPLDGAVSIAGRVTDADGACGDGAAWRIERRTAAGTWPLAEGAFPNGGASDLAGEALRAVPVRAGESVELLILPQNGHACDTTVVELRLTATDGRSWSLTADTLRAPGRNPAPDAYGHAAVWRFADLGAAPGAALPEAVRAAWRAGDLAGAAEAFRAAAPADSPFAPGAEDEFPAAVQAELARRQREIASLQARLPAARAYANGAQEGGVPESPHAGIHDVRLHRRGRYDQLGELVPRGVPAVLSDGAPFVIARGSGRLELARWIASPRNPLTARVLVNRVWQHHFGQGLVRTPSNFGTLGEAPSHPELLDWLASSFWRRGGSLKALHRQIVLSQAYRQSSVASAKARRADPDNRWLARQNRHRLEAETLRDSLLAASGRLETTAGGVAFRDFSTPRRSVYRMTVRSDRTGFGPLFDAADSTASVEKRTVSTIAPQALYLMNHPFVLEQARGLAGRLRALPGDDLGRIDTAYRQLYARPPSAAESAIGTAFVARFRAAEGEPAAWDAYAQLLLCANEFMYVD